MSFKMGETHYISLFHRNGESSDPKIGKYNIFRFHVSNYLRLFELIIILLYAVGSAGDEATVTYFTQYDQPEFSTMSSLLIQSGGEDGGCERHERCSECIQTLGCVWCKDKNVSMESIRCFSNLTRPAECESFESPQGKDVPISENRNMKIFPQVVDLHLRKGEKRNITMTYTDTKNRPLDLYILMDLSCTMQTHKERVANLSMILAQNLKNLTSDLKIGFGTFVDKPLAPFGYLVPDLVNKTCEGVAIRTLPYAFKNHLKMTHNISQFINEVKSAGISFNLDVPEGTLDGMLQSIVCTDGIGWRQGKGNRRLLVVSTDGSFHLAGDGKLVGVVLPHDGKCYMDSSGMYTHATTLDYPSISLIREKVKENDVFVIFAVTKDQQDNYRQLSQALHPFAVTQEIDSNTNSITSVIENEYRKLVNTVTILSEHKQKDRISIKFFAKCPGETEFKETNQCNEVGPGVKVSFKIEVELKDCPSNANLWKANLTIYPQSSSDDSMAIRLNMLCGCECEAEAPLEILSEMNKSAECSSNGYLRCGICECLSSWGGPYCNCTVGENGVLDKDQCLDPNSGNICNERGTCDSCGKCRCNAVNGDSNAFGGKYCECDNTNCDFQDEDEGLCNKDATNGPHGNCHCSQCVCEEGYEGSRCQCPTSEEKCKDAKSPLKICNGLGSCKCGACQCEAAYKGQYCEIQHAKIEGSCETSRASTIKCIRCLVSHDDEEKADEARKLQCKDECLHIDITFKERIDRIPVEDEKNVCVGTEEDARGCRIDYIIREKNLYEDITKLEIESGKIVLREKCPTPAPLFEIMIGIIGVMVLLGVVLLLLWKTITHAQDKKEYERFQKSLHAAAWNTEENPLYVSTTVTVRNPTYINYQKSSDEAINSEAS